MEGASTRYRSDTRATPHSPLEPPARAVAFGITGKDYVLIASDTSAARSIVKMKANEDKQRVVGKHLVMACPSSRSPSPSPSPHPHLESRVIPPLCGPR